MFDTSTINSKVKVCDYPEVTKEVLDGMVPYLNLIKLEKTVEVGTILGFKEGTGWVLADKDDQTTQDYLCIVADQDGRYVWISPFAHVELTGATENAIAYLGNDGAILWEAPETNAIKIGYGTSNGIQFMGG